MCLLPKRQPFSPPACHLLQAFNPSPVEANPSEKETKGNNLIINVIDEPQKGWYALSTSSPSLFASTVCLLLA